MGGTVAVVGGMIQGRKNRKAQAQQMSADRGERMRLFEASQEAMDTGMKEGEEKAKGMTANIDYKKEAEDELARKRAAKDKGLTAEQFTETQRRFKTSSRALRGSMASAGVRGGTAAQAQASQYVGMQESQAALSASIQRKYEEDYDQAVARQQGLRLSLPLAYGRMRGGQATSAAQMAAANQKTPQQQPGLLGQVFGGLF